MKNLANCNPREFLFQTNKIRKSVSRWLTDTDIANIRRRMPEVPKDISEEDKEKAMQVQARKNFDAILDACLDDHFDETLEVLSLICFIEPEEIEKYQMYELLESINEMIDNQAVMGFFTSLTRLMNLDI